MPHILQFADLDKSFHDLVGGKAGNLGVLTQAGFPVPSGFAIDTAAYTRFLSENGIDQEIQKRIGALNFDDPEELEKQTTAIRDAVFNAKIPRDIEAAIVESYGTLGDGVYVAVRSSGTSEDIEDASSAGLHDTYLEINGADAVTDAVKRCWASLWTSRAVAYRNSKGIDNLGALIAVVVQTMVRSEISGVMFTGNPLTAANDEFVINASWGLGEAVVSGIVNPDQFTVKHATLKIKEKVIGSKSLKVINHLDGSPGTFETEVEDADRNRFSLSDEQVTELAALGRDVQEHYGDFPQDIEWGYANGQFYLLQARPITGVDFAWEHCLEDWQTTPDDDEFMWSRGMADENWTGAISPLMYSWRARTWDDGSIPGGKLWGWDDIANTRFWKYYKGTAYYNAAYERLLLERSKPPAILPYYQTGLNKMPPNWRDEVLDENRKFDYLDWLRSLARVQLMDPQFYKAFETCESYVFDPKWLEKARPYTDEEIRNLSNSELKRFIDEVVDFEGHYNKTMWTWFFVYAPDMYSTLNWIIDKWYDGEHDGMFLDLISGTNERTATLHVNYALWELSEIIRNTPELLDAFSKYEGEEFHEQIADLKAGKKFRADYAEFLSKFGHRGQSDRDIYFPRRADDLSIDYMSLKAILNAPAQEDPGIAEEALKETRAKLKDDVVENLKKQPFGWIRAEIFKVVMAWIDRFLICRDNERGFIDYATNSIRKGFLEMNRRLIERGSFETDRDFWFLGKTELFDLFDGRGDGAELRQAKIRARMKNFDAFDRKEMMPPPYLQGGKELYLDEDQHDGNTLVGLGVARGAITGTARVTKSLKDIGKVQNGEILIVNATDPGWTPVFSVISGIVLETGGITAHASCLAREYGMPAVQIPNALKLIPDGATITVNGGAGMVILEDGDASDDEPTR